MSGNEIAIEMVFKDKLFSEYIFNILHEFNSYKTSIKEYLHNITALNNTGCNVSSLFTEITSSCNISGLYQPNNKTIIIWIECGKTGGLVFWNRFYKTFSTKDIESIIGYKYFDLSGTWELRVYSYQNTFRYESESLDSILNYIDDERIYQSLQRLLELS